MDHPIDAQLGINKSTSIPGESPGLIDSIRKNKMLKLSIEPIKEHVEAPNTDNDSISSGSPLGDKAQYSPKGLVLGGVDYNFNTSYCYYPTIFDSLPTKAVSEDEEDDDDRYLWEPKTKAANEKDIIFGHTEKEKGESEEDKRKKALEKDREPNFFVNDEGFRVTFAI